MAPAPSLVNLVSAALHHLKKRLSLFLSIFAAAVVDSTLKGFLTSLFDRYGAVLPDLGSEREERGVAAAVAAAAVGFIPAV